MAGLPIKLPFPLPAGSSTSTPSSGGIPFLWPPVVGRMVTGGKSGTILIPRPKSGTIDGAV